jgi:hypothetical protein
MNNDPLSHLLSIVEQIIGTTCWKVAAAGGATGSHFNLDFGNMIEWPVDTTRMVPLEMQRGTYGEFGVQVGCASWRLDSENAPITAWTDIASPDGPMVKGLRLLQDCIVTDAKITKPGLDLLLEFNKNYSLRVFCDQFDEQYDNYSVSFRDVYLMVKARSHIISQSGSDPA